MNVYLPDFYRILIYQKTAILNQVQSSFQHHKILSDFPFLRKPSSCVLIKPKIHFFIYQTHPCLWSYYCSSLTIWCSLAHHGNYMFSPLREHYGTLNNELVKMPPTHLWLDSSNRWIKKKHNSRTALVISLFQLRHNTFCPVMYFFFCGMHMTAIHSHVNHIHFSLQLSYSFKWTADNIT